MILFLIGSHQLEAIGTSPAKQRCGGGVGGGGSWDDCWLFCSPAGSSWCLWVWNHSLAWSGLQPWDKRWGRCGGTVKASVGERPHRRKTSELWKRLGRKRKHSRAMCLLRRCVPELRPQTERFRRLIRRRWCSGLGQGTAPSASTGGPRTLPERVKGQRVISALQILPWSDFCGDAPRKIPVFGIGTNSRVEFFKWLIFLWLCLAFTHWIFYMWLH